ncbi:MAG: hypothetical protein OHK0052_01490 [Anaerolineales bacterium]
MKRRFEFVVLLLVVISSPLFWYWHAQAVRVSNSVTVPTSPIAESNDYATQILGDPWDLTEFSDISQYFNAKYNAPSPDNPYFYPRDPVIKDHSLANGIFTGTSVDTVFTGKNGWFMPLFPGYETAVHLGKTGSHYPIKSSTYGCFYIALKTNSGPNRNAQNGGPDQYRIFWFADDKLNSNPPNTYGFSVGQALYPEIVGTGSVPTPRWQLLKIDLRTVTNAGPINWLSLSEWQGLRFEPTIQDNVSYQVDWMRLTDCSANKITVTFSPDASIVSVWARPEGSTRDILLAQDVNGSSGTYQLDTQGLAAGRYQIGFGTGSGFQTPPTCCSQRSTQFITINQAPIATFENPAPYSGEDYATMDGNAWDISDDEDYYGIVCAEYGREDTGLLWFNTPDVEHQSPECKNVGLAKVSDPSIYMRVGQPVDPTEYRYLTYRMFTDAAYQDVPNGMIVRWVWSIQGSSGRPGYLCHLVTQDLPYDVGWGIYTLDLWNPFSGSAEEFAGECDGLNKSWRESDLAYQIRFDPNENITGYTFFQKLDWVRLTKPISVARGQVYNIALNKFFSGDSFTTTLYYTTDPKNQPTQNTLTLYTPPPPPAPAPNIVYLPLVRKDGDPFIGQGDLNFVWDTATVNPGEYYICAVLNDGLNQSTVCSEVTITVTN